MRLLVILIAWTSVVWAQSDQAVDKDVRDGLDSLLVVPPVDSVIAAWGTLCSSHPPSELASSETGMGCLTSTGTRISM